MANKNTQGLVLRSLTDIDDSCLFLDGKDRFDYLFEDCNYWPGSVGEMAPLSWVSPFKDNVRVLLPLQLAL